jgi:hypothetical protein
VDWSRWSVVRGTVRTASGEPAGDCAIWGEPATLPEEPLPDIAFRTGQDGSYLLPLPPATYTIKVNGLSSSCRSLGGEATGVVVTASSDITVDIIVTEDQD